MEGNVSNLHEMVKKILKNHIQTVALKAEGLAGRTKNSEFPRRNTEVQIMEERGERYGGRHGYEGDKSRGAGWRRKEGEYGRKKEMLGREPTSIELHSHTHKRQEDKQWVDERVRKVYEEYTRLRESQAAAGEGPSGGSAEISDYRTWSQAVGGVQHVRVYGLGSQAYTYEWLTSGSSSFSPSTQESLFTQQIVALTAELEQVRKSQVDWQMQMQQQVLWKSILKERKKIFLLMLQVSGRFFTGNDDGKLIMEHFSCFPNLGKIKVHGLMVKKKSFFYHLSDSMAIKHVFKELSGTWLLHLNASSIQNAKFALSEEQAEMRFLNTSFGKNVKKWNPVAANKLANNSEVKSTFGKNFNPEHQSKHDCCQAFQNDRSTVSEHPIEDKVHESLSSLENSRKSSQTISVTGIISKFFSELDEVDSFYCQPKNMHETVHVRIDELRDSNIRTLASQPDHICNRKTVEFDTDKQCSFAKKQEKNLAERAKVASKVKKMQQLGSKKLVNKKSSLCTPHKSCKYRVGKRLVQAANSIQTSGNGKKSITKFLSECKSYDSAVFVRRIAYDVDDFID
ncbi:hypothetical protein M5K25_026832 [Dendrobium thyrsiflorum]|uniref:Uncharacterized protein n=1 Tax=Dendrobium thyrsiflorum TaxID=117978 RepID=A0ABD0TYD7_DENTH